MNHVVEQEPNQVPGGPIRQIADSPRVLHVVAPSRFGGAETVILQLAAGHRARGADVRICCLLGSDRTHPFPGRARQEGLEVFEIQSQPRAYLQEVRRLVEVTTEYAPQVLHSHGYHSDLVAWRAARRLGAGLLSTVHGFTGGDFKNRVYESFDRWMLRRFDRVVAVSEAGALGLRRSGLRSARLHVILNAFRPIGALPRRAAREALGLEPDGIVIGWVGRFTTVKGPDLFVQAIAGLPPGGWSAVMVGDGPERVPCEGQARAAGLPAAKLRFSGARADAGRLMKAFDILVLSSRSEGVPMVLLEAVDAGTPVVARAVGGIPEVLPRGCGWLVAPDEPLGLIQALSTALTDPEETARRAASARDVVLGALDFDRWLQAYAEIYRSLQAHRAQAGTGK